MNRARQCKTHPAGNTRPYCQGLQRRSGALCSLPKGASPLACGRVAPLGNGMPPFPAGRALPQTKGDALMRLYSCDTTLAAMWRQHTLRFPFRTCISAPSIILAWVQFVTTTLGAFWRPQSLPSTQSPLDHAASMALRGDCALGRFCDSPSPRQLVQHGACTPPGSPRKDYDHQTQNSPFHVFDQPSGGL